MTIPTHLPSFSPTNDLLIIIAIAAVAVVGTMIGHARLKLLTMSIYVGGLIATEAMPLLHQLIGSPGGLLALVNFRFLALGLSVGILGLTGANAYHKAIHNNTILNMVIATTAGFLLVVITLSLLEPGARGATLNSSTLANMIYDSRLAWYLAPALLLMFGGLFHGRRH